MKAEAAGRWKDGMKWREVGRRETCVWALDTETLRLFEVPEVSLEVSRIYICTYTRIHPPRHAAISIIIDIVWQMGQKKRRNLCPGNQRNFASSGLPRFPRAKNALVTVDLLKSLTSTPFRFEDRYYQFCAAEVNDGQRHSYHDFHWFRFNSFLFYHPTINNGQFLIGNYNRKSERMKLQI